MDQILPGLYIGSLREAANLVDLKRHNITLIVNLSDEPNIFPDDFDYIRIDVDDVATERDKLMAALRDTGTLEHIHEVLAQREAVLVHCHAGISRSSTVVVLYLVRYQHMSIKEAIAFVRERHRKAFLLGVNFL